MHVDITSVSKTANKVVDGVCNFNMPPVIQVYKNVVINSPRKEMPANLRGDHNSHVDSFGVLFVFMFRPLFKLVIILSHFYHLIKKLCPLFATFL